MYTHIEVILDRSGSMFPLKDDMEKGFWEFVKDQRKLDGKCTMSLTQFDTTAIDRLYEFKALHDVPPMELSPRGGTPLLDAVGQTIDYLGNALRNMPSGSRPERVLVMILTDGQENQSHKYTKEQIKAMIEQQTNVYKWEFLYLGANVDAFAEASALGINVANAAAYAATPTGAHQVFAAASNSARSYRVGGSSAIADEDRKKLDEEVKKH